MKKAAMLLLLPLILANIYGCWFIVGGAVGAAGIYAVSKDAIQTETDTPYDSLWEAAVTVAKNSGVIREENRPAGYIAVQIQSSSVQIRLVRLTRVITRLRVSSRKYHLPNLSLAEDTLVKIIAQAK